jgi:hypothetical protein
MSFIDKPQERLNLKLNRTISIIFSIGLLLLVSCVTNQNTSVTIHKAAHEDEDYQSSLEKKTREVHVYDTFQSEFKVSVTYLDNEFRDSLAKRTNSVLLKERIKDLHIEDRVAFFVVLSTPNRKAQKLDNSKLWTVAFQGKDSDSKLVASEIKYIREKSQTQLLFTGVDTWSKEFLVIFDKSEESISGDFDLLITNGTAEVKLRWP